jgi:DNA-binding beta-propeller fold protein YncE
VFDAVTMRLLAIIPLGAKPEFAAADSAGHIFVNIEDRNEIVEIDARTDRVLAHWPLAGCEEPSGLAFDGMRQRLFSVCANRVMAVTDSATGKAVARIAIGAKPDAAAYDPRTGTVFASNGDGTLSVIRQRDADHYDVSATVPTHAGARTMALDRANGRVYLPFADAHAFGVLVVGRSPEN